ncbi:MAG TPA: response regulator [Caulobacteraceae bacterium]|jgi:FixJ family two-component response regulator|nr:response regulator [Caulobacteraceae bacterium]
MTQPADEDSVIVIDDDRDVRDALGRLLRSVGLQVHLHGSVPEFLSAGRPDGPACLVLDVRLPGQSGLDLQRELSSSGMRLPIVFITGHGDIAMSVQAMKGGAIEFLTKPFRDQDLLDAVQSGLEQARRLRENDKVIAQLVARYDSLTPREREVMAAVVAGRLNKQIAADVGLSEVTVKLHRGNLMRKMAAGSVAELALMAEKLKASQAAKP